MRPADGYRNAQGKRIPSVTTILGARVSKGLMGWANKRWNELAEAALTMEPDDLVAHVHSARDNEQIKRRAGDIGTAVHAGWLLDQPYQPKEAFTPEELADVARGVELLKARETSERFERLLVEHSMVHPDGCFGGTVDLVGRLPNGQTFIADLKTGSSVYEEHIAQIAAYRQLLRLTWADMPDVIKSPVVGRIYLLVRDKETQRLTGELQVFHLSDSDLVTGLGVFEADYERYLWSRSVGHILRGLTPCE